VISILLLSIFLFMNYSVHTLHISLYIYIDGHVGGVRLRFYAWTTTGPIVYPPGDI
jgi:hypothetical protein